MKIILVLLLIGLKATCVFAQSRYDRSDYTFETADTSFNITLNSRQTHGDWRISCNGERTSRIGYQFIHGEYRDSMQQFFIATVKDLVGEKIANRLYFYQLESFNDADTVLVDSIEIQSDTPKCAQVHYKFDSFFMFDDSICIPLQIYVNLNGELMNQTSIIETLQGLSSFQLQSPVEIFRMAYSHRHFKEYPMDKRFEIHYSEKSKLFYYQVMANDGKLLEKSRNLTVRKMNHMYVDAISGKTLWKPTLIRKDHYGSCTWSWEIVVPKNSITGK